MPTARSTCWALPLPLPLPPHVRADGWGPPMGIVRPHVGAPWGTLPGGAGQAQLGARSWITATDDEVRNIPVYQWVIQLQDTIFKWADELGVGDYARTIVYSIRTFSYASSVVSVLSVQGGGAASAAAGGASTVTITGGVAALGAVVVIVSIVDALFGGGDTDVVGQMASAAKAVLHLRDRLTLAEFAEEQDVSAFLHQSLASVPLLVKDKQKHLADAAIAKKLAAFYRTADASLDSDQRAAFESISNLSRWEATLAEYEKLPSGESYGAFATKGTIDKYLGTPLPSQVQPQIEKEKASLAATLSRHTGGSESPLWSAAKVVLALTAGGLLGVYLLEKPLFFSLLRRGTSAITHLPQQAATAVTRAIR